MYVKLKRAAQAIRDAQRIVLCGHENPDGDSLGSVLALARALRTMGKVAVPLSTDGVPVIYGWLPGQDSIARESARRDFDLAIMCDTGSLERVGRARAAMESAPSSLCIDHHVANGTFGSIRIANARYASTGEIVYELVNELGVTIDRPIADCLMCAVVTDTGGFRFMNTTAATFRVASALMKHGACPAQVSELVFESRSVASLKLLGRALDSIEVSDEGQVAWARVRATDFEALGAADEDTEGIVTHVRSVRGARVGVLFREVPGKKVRISLRSREGFDVNRIAQVFGGGGHKLAAGCSHDPPLEAAERNVLAEVRKWLAE